MLLEIACFNLASVLTAQKAGASRIELCENYPEGGITPSQDLIINARKNLQVDLFVMIRPRPGNFAYTNEEFKDMRSQVEFCKAQNCNGLVFGILTADHKVDRVRCSELVAMAAPLPCTFHRAFDLIKDQDEAIDDIIQCGFKRILTSGKQSTAFEGANEIQKLILRSQNRVTIMPGGNVRSSNVAELLKKTGATEIHSAALRTGNEIADESEIKAILSKFL